MTAESGQKALGNGRSIGSGYSGMCQMFVREKCWQVPSLYGSAIEAWNGARDKHPGDRTPPVGAPCYYRGGNYGHAVISTGNGAVMRSTDCTYANDISEVDIGWVESHWGYEYLGWTGDLNGVDLPLGGNGEDDDDMPLNDSDIEKIAHRVNMVLGDYDSEGNKRDPKENDPDQGNRRIRQIENVVRSIQEDVNAIRKAVM